MNQIKANSPVPHLGYLSLVTEPEHGVTVTQADTAIATQPEMQLPVANYEWTFSRRGYTPVTRRFHISRGETLHDTVVLRKIQYVPRTTAYAAAALEASSRPGVNFTIGGMISGIDLSASYTLGLGHTGEVSWYNETDNIFNQSTSYRVDEWAVRLGYCLRFAERFGLTPQAGFLQQRLLSRDGDHAGNGFTVECVSIGARLSWHPVPHLSVFITPEYAVPMSSKGDIVEVCRLAGLTRGGFRAYIGLSVNL